MLPSFIIMMTWKAGKARRRSTFTDRKSSGSSQHQTGQDEVWCGEDPECLLPEKVLLLLGLCRLPGHHDDVGTTETIYAVA